MAGQGKAQMGLRALDSLFGNPRNQMKGFPNREDAAFSAATALAARLRCTFKRALAIVDQWYRERGV